MHLDPPGSWWVGYVPPFPAHPHGATIGLIGSHADRAIIEQAPGEVACSTGGNVTVITLLTNLNAKTVGCDGRHIFEPDAMLIYQADK